MDKEKTPHTTEDHKTHSSRRTRASLGGVLGVVFHPIVRTLVESIIFFSLILIVFLGSARELPFLKDQQFFIVMSGSMEPTIKTGSLILVNKEASEPKKDDVITFFTPRTKAVTTHRVLNTVKEDTSDKLLISTKGDANQDADPWILTTENVLGKVKFAVPYLGYIVNYAKTPKGFLLVAVLPGAILVLDEVWNIKKVMQQEYEKKIAALKNELNQAKQHKS